MWKFWKRKKAAYDSDEDQIIEENSIRDPEEDPSESNEANGEAKEGGLTNEGVSEEAKAVEGEGTPADKIKTEESETVRPEAEDPKKENLEAKDPETEDQETKGSKTEDLETEDQEIKGSKTEDLEAEDQETEGSKTEDLEAENQETEGLETEDQETEGSETEDFEAEDSETEESGKDDETEAEAIGGEENVKEKKKGFFARLREGLAKTRDNIARGIDRLFTANEIDDDFYEELEEILIMGDIGVNATTEIIDRLKDQVKERHLKKPMECKDLLIESIREQMEVGETAYDFETQQSIIMVIGVNGVGKTTTVGKLAWKLKDNGKKVLIAAADTFRAAAGDQLAEWARRAGVPMIGGKEGADPASVVFDAVSAAKARGVDVLLIDTAGRLHNKKNLMEELRKMNRIIDKEYPNAHRENLIVLDGTTGQNALAQAREFGDVTNLTGIVLTKMDGTAKGGIAVAIQSELGIPVKYIGVGETTQDLQKFDPDDFVRALFDVDISEENFNINENDRTDLDD